MRFYPSRARRSSCWSTCPPPVSAGMRVPCANRTDSSTQHQRYHLLSVADLNSSRNRNFVHMKGERQRRRRPRVLKRNSAKLNTLAAGKAAYLNFANNLFASSCDSRRPARLFFSFDQSVMLLSRIGAMSGRVKMSKFLLTVCAFGLLLSFAFAEEKSPEQHREESNQIGLQKMNWTRVVASGIIERIGFFYAVNPDCSASGDINIRITKQPEHGTAETAAATSFPNFERENIRYRCNQHEVRGQQLNYKSAEKYIGSDTLELLVLLPGGFAQEVHINIDVR